MSQLSVVLPLPLLLLLCLPPSCLGDVCNAPLGSFFVCSGSVVKFAMPEQTILDLFGLSSELDVRLGPGKKRVEIIHADERRNRTVDVLRLEGPDLEEIVVRVPTGIVIREDLCRLFLNNPRLRRLSVQGSQVWMRREQRCDGEGKKGASVVGETRSVVIADSVVRVGNGTAGRNLVLDLGPISSVLLSNVTVHAAAAAVVAEEEEDSGKLRLSNVTFPSPPPPVHAVSSSQRVPQEVGFVILASFLLGNCIH